MSAYTLSLNYIRNFAIDFPLSKLYSNALLSTLNARLSWKRLGALEAEEEEEDNVLFGKPVVLEHDNVRMFALVDPDLAQTIYSTRPLAWATGSLEFSAPMTRARYSVSHEIFHS